MAAALALLVLYVPHGRGLIENPVANVGLEDIELLTDNDAVPLNGDQDVDYDFYEWAATEAAGSTASALPMAALKATTSRSPTTSAVVTAISAVPSVTRWQGNELLPWGTTTLQLPTVRSDVTLPGRGRVTLPRPTYRLERARRPNPRLAPAKSPV